MGMIGPSSGSGSSGANVNLSNLASVSINSNLLFQSSVNIGSGITNGAFDAYINDQAFIGTCRQTLVSQAGTGFPGFLYAGNWTSVNVMLGTVSGGGNIGAFIGWIDSTNGYIGLYNSITDGFIHFGVGNQISIIDFGVNSTPSGIWPHTDGASQLGKTANRWSNVFTKINSVSGTQVTLTGSAGTALCSQPDQGATYKKVIIYLSGYTDTGTLTYTYPTAFTNTPYVYGLTAGVAGATAGTTTVTFTVTTLTGFVFIEGY